MNITQEKFNRYLLQQVLHLQAENSVLTSTIIALSMKISMEHSEPLRNEIRVQVQAVYEKLLISHPLIQDDRDSDLQSWIDQN